MIKFEIAGTPVVLAKAFKAEEGVALSAEIASMFALAGKRVVIIDHPPTGARSFRRAPLTQPAPAWCRSASLSATSSSPTRTRTA